MTDVRVGRTTAGAPAAPGPLALGDPPPASRLARGRWITDWEPENDEFWASTGRRVARRNLAWSMLAENLGFSVWLLWSVVAVSLPSAGFPFTTDQLFWLVAVPNLVGSTLRLPYTFAVPRFGGRNWTVLSALLLLVPTGMVVAAVTDPTTPYWFFLIAAATAGVGGGNFASSMANISFFYPEKRKGLALGLNAAGGNIGVAVVQRFVPVLIGVGGIAVIGAAQAGPKGKEVFLQNAGLVWVPLILVAAVGSWLFMDNLAVSRSRLREQLSVARHGQTWVLSVLYVATFGSFIGYSAALPLLIKLQYPHVVVAHYAFLGALVGSLVRPVGGWLSDRLGGARVTLWNFGVMAIGTAGVWWTVSTHQGFGLFLACFLVLFVSTGIGNGSTFRMIPAIFRHRAVASAAAAGRTVEEALVVGRREGAAVLGITSAIGAFGGFLVPRGFAMSLAHTGSLATALAAFLGFYVVCSSVTWWCYLRRRVLSTRMPSLATAHI